MLLSGSIIHFKSLSVSVRMLFRECKGKSGGVKLSSFSHYTMSTKLEKTSLSGQVYILTRLVEYLVKCSYYTMSTKLEKTSLSGQVYILTRLVEYLVKCSYYTMSTKLEKTSLSGQVYILTRLVEYLVKCSYYTTPSGHDAPGGCLQNQSS